MPSPHKCESTTTSAQAYQAWPLETAASAAPAVRAATGFRFEAETETRLAYQAKPLPQSTGAPATASAGLVRSLPFEGQSESKAAYQPVLLRSGAPGLSMPALGVVTEGGHFHSLIPAASLPPTRGSATFTTVTARAQPPPASTTTPPRRLLAQASPELTGAHLAPPSP